MEVIHEGVRFDAHPLLVEGARRARIQRDVVMLKHHIGQARNERRSDLVAELTKTLHVVEAQLPQVWSYLGDARRCYLLGCLVGDAVEYFWDRLEEIPENRVLAAQLSWVAQIAEWLRVNHHPAYGHIAAANARARSRHKVTITRVMGG